MSVYIMLTQIRSSLLAWTRTVLGSESDRVGGQSQLKLKSHNWFRLMSYFASELYYHGSLDVDRGLWMSYRPP